MATYSAVLGDDRCECFDSSCPCDHETQCTYKATMTLWRIDMEDVTGTRFCNQCGDDAMESGVFTNDPEEDNPELDDLDDPRSHGFIG